MCKDTKKFTISQVRKHFSDDEKCLQKVFNIVYGADYGCLKCHSVNSYKKITGRRAYQCSKCRKQIYPTKGTIFQKTTTPLSDWFYVMHIFTTSKNGLPAKRVQREIGVTYETALRMLRQIRKLTKTSNGNPLSGTIELDETFVGGKNKNRHRDKKFKYVKDAEIKDKVTVFGMFQRGGLVSAFAVPNRRAETLIPIIHQNIDLGSTLMTDEWTAYSGLGKHFDHQAINHKRGQYVNGNCTTNRIENFWSTVKRTIKGSYIHVSKKYIQTYIDECVFRFNNRNNKQIFETMLSYVASTPF